MTAERICLGTEFYSWQSGQLRDASGNDVPLRAKSLKMFAVLLSERGKVLSKDRLSELVWPDTVATDESIARCIADIRKALSDDRHNIVQTYPKQGYRLNAAGAAGGTVKKTKRFGVHWQLIALICVGALLVFSLLRGTDLTPETDSRTARGTTAPNIVAIVPFKGEGEAGQFIAAGLSDDLEIHLSEMSGVKVLSHALTASVANETSGPLEIVRSLGASHIVLGHLRQSGNQIALTIQLVDGVDGATLWVDRYEGPREGIIPFRDAVPEALVHALSVELNAHDLSRLSARDTDSPEALAEVMHARRELSQFTYESSLAAEKRLRRAIAIDPQYARAYAELAAAYAIRMENDWIILSHADTQKAFYFAEQAVRSDPDLWYAHYAMGRLHSVASSGDIETALYHLRRGMELNPANDDARAYYAIVVMMSGGLEEARTILESVIAAHPNAPFWYYLGLGNALFYLRDYDAALAATTQCLNQMPNSPYCLRTQMAVQARLGLADDVAWTIEEYEMLGYEVSLDAAMKSSIERVPAMIEHLRESYVKAGLN